MSIKYFENLDGLRFFAAATVAFSHLETIKSYQSLFFIQNRFFFNSPALAVTFFFVLSGFLMTWWFLEESDGYVRRINIKKFYINRFSRIIPLYFLVVLLSFLIGIINSSYIVDGYFFRRLACYFLFLPNTADIVYKADIFLGPSWSLSVEILFYLIFPFLISNTNRKYLGVNFLVIAALFIILSTITNPIFIAKIHFTKYISHTIQIFITIFERYRLYSFLLGGSAAYFLYFNETEIKHFLFIKYRNITLFFIAITVLFFLFGITFSFLNHQVYSILFSFFILFFACSQKTYYLLNNKVVKVGGKLSYGVYMLHMFVVLKLTNQGRFLFDFSNKQLSVTLSWIIYLILIFTIPYISFQYFEKPAQKYFRKILIQKGQ